MMCCVGEGYHSATAFKPQFGGDLSIVQFKSVSNFNVNSSSIKLSLLLKSAGPGA